MQLKIISVWRFFLCAFALNIQRNGTVVCCMFTVTHFFLLFKKKNFFLLFKREFVSSVQTKMDIYNFVDDDESISSISSPSTQSSETASNLSPSTSQTSQESAYCSQDLYEWTKNEKLPFGYGPERFEYFDDVDFVPGRRCNTKIVVINCGSECGHTYEFNAKLKCGSQTWRCNFCRKCKSRIYRLKNGQFGQVCDEIRAAHTRNIRTAEEKSHNASSNG